MEQNIDTHPIHNVSSDEAISLGLELQELGTHPNGLIVGLAKDMNDDSLEPFFKALKGAGDHLQTRLHVHTRDVTKTKPQKVMEFAEDVEVFERDVNMAYSAIDQKLTEVMTKASSELFSNQQFQITELDKALLSDTLGKLKSKDAIELMTQTQKYGEIGIVLAQAGYIELQDRQIKMLNMHYSGPSLEALNSAQEHAEVLNRIVRESMVTTTQNKNKASQIRDLQNRKLKRT